MVAVIRHPLEVSNKRLFATPSRVVQRFGLDFGNNKTKNL